LCKAPGATLAPFSLQPTDAFDRIWSLNRPVEISARAYFLCYCFSRGNAAAHTGHSEDLILLTAKGGESIRVALIYAFACLHALHNHVGFAPSSPVALMRRLVRPWTVFPSASQTSTFRSIFGTIFVGNSRVATRSCEHLSRHLLGLR
jgi:hypothetical protein